MTTDMSVFIVLQKPGSIYNDEEGVGYEYPTSIANGRQIEEGDYLVCCLTKKTSEEGRRVFGVGRVEFIRYYSKDGREYAFAEYRMYREISPPLTFDEIGGDPRNNWTNAITRVPEDREESLLAAMLSPGLEYETVVDREEVPEEGVVLAAMLSPELDYVAALDKEEPEEKAVEIYHGDGYPLIRVFGGFPEGAIEDIASGVAKKEAFLKAVRNVKGISSQDIETALIGYGKPLAKFGYSRTRFVIDEGNRAELDGYSPELRIAIEVEKGRGLMGNQIFLDLWKFMLLDEVEYGVILIPVESREGRERPFAAASRKLAPVESRLSGLGLKGLAVIGY